MTQFKENLSVTSTIKPNQSESIHDHVWLDSGITCPRKIGDDLFLEVTDCSIDHSFDIKFNKSDAIAIAKHFNLLPKKPDFTESIELQKELMEEGNRVLSSMAVPKELQGNNDGNNKTAIELLNGEPITAKDLEVTKNDQLVEYGGFMSEDRE